MKDKADPLSFATARPRGCSGSCYLDRVPLLLVLLWQAPLSFTLKNDVAVGQKPAIELHAIDRVTEIRIELVSNDGQHVTLSHPGLAAGQRATLAIGGVPPGKHHFTGTLSLTIVGHGPWSYDLDFDTLVRAAMEVRYDWEHLDLTGHVLRFQLSRPARSAELKVLGEDGGELGGGSASFHGEPPGTWLALPWTQQPRKVMTMKLHAVASDGVSADVDLYPWSVTIEHEDVNFETDSAVVRPTEASKLDRSLQKIEQVVRDAQRFIKVKLWVAGHTDTVGTKDHNRKLSLDRARAIADYFRRKGLKIPISYEGFGEDLLKVRTPDETDEPRNRRADYVVGAASAPPPIRGDWKDLK